jgi:hypothetical protein
VFSIIQRAFTKGAKRKRKHIRTGYSIDYLYYNPDGFARIKNRSSMLDSAFSESHQEFVGRC